MYNHSEKLPITLKDGEYWINIIHFRNYLIIRLYFDRIILYSPWLNLVEDDWGPSAASGVAYSPYIELCKPLSYNLILFYLKNK